jgi:hypothetical protein
MERFAVGWRSSSSSADKSGSCSARRSGQPRRRFRPMQGPCLSPMPIRARLAVRQECYRFSLARKWQASVFLHCAITRQSRDGK